MPSIEIPAGEEPSRSTGRVRRILDLAFGFFVWAIHFLGIYIGAALACVLGIGEAEQGMHLAFLALLGSVTLAAAAVVIVHAYRRRRRQHAAENHFRMAVAIGCDAIAALAILGQLIPVALVPLCA
jgi:purine-cytosine permease-like protein